MLILSADLLFGSQLLGALAAAGHDAELLSGEGEVRVRLDDRDASAGALIVDLTDGELDGAGILERLAGEGRLEGVRTLAFFAHVDLDARERARRAAFDLAVPRSRIAREAPALLAGLGV